MPNDYFELTEALDIDPHVLARDTDINAIAQAIEAAFEKLPDELRIKQGRVTYAADSGVADAYVISLSNSPPSYAEGLTLAMKAANSNTGASTINVNGLGAKTIKRYDGSDLSANDILASMIVMLTYNGTNFILVSYHAAQEANAAASATSAASSASAASSSASSAATSLSNAQSVYDSFDDRYLGAKGAAQSTDNDGDALVAGTLYFDTVTGQMKVWDGSAWDNAYTNLPATATIEEMYAGTGTDERLVTPALVKAADGTIAATMDGAASAGDLGVIQEDGTVAKASNTAVTEVVGTPVDTILNSSYGCHVAFYNEALDKVVHISGHSSNVYVNTATVDPDDNSISYGSSETLSPAVGGSVRGLKAIYFEEHDTYVVIVHAWSSANVLIYAFNLDEAGAVDTVDAITASTGGDSGGNIADIVKIGDNLAAAIHSDSSGNVRGHIVEVDGPGAITCPVLNSAMGPITSGQDRVALMATGYDESFFVLYQDTGGLRSWYATVTESRTTIRYNWAQDAAEQYNMVNPANSMETMGALTDQDYGVAWVALVGSHDLRIMSFSLRGQQPFPARMVTVVCGTFTSSADSISLTFNPDAECLNVVYNDPNNSSYVMCRSIDVKGVEFLRMSEPVQLISVAGNNNGALSTGCYIPSHKLCVLPFSVSIDVYSAVWRDDYTLIKSAAGIFQDDYADGANATLKTLGAVDANQSGLTPGKTYYPDANGVLGLVDYGYGKEFLAKSATELLITKL